jgi:thioredoxin reductase (NADPH)
MIAPDDLLCCSIFKCLDDSERRRFAERAADVRLQEDEWLIREGDIPSFCVVLSGELRLLKTVLGREQEIAQYQPGNFFGEVPILLGGPSFASIRARTAGRVARFDQQILFELIQSSAACSALILQTMTDRLTRVQEYVKEVPGSRVLLVGRQYDEESRDIRNFLSANRIPFEWVDAQREPERVPACMAGETDHLSVILDHAYCVETPTVRNVAEALGIRTTPKYTSYDVVVVGAGPAGLAAGVYGASEGLKVLVVERAAVGGQAGTSSRIENYLGFPNGVSGDELSERALKQAARFGAEIAMTRSVGRIESLEEGGYCVQMEGGLRVSACVVIIATGVEWRMLKAEGVERLQGRGVLYGASRNEASNVVGKRIFIVGGGNSAGQAAVFFSNYAEEVTMLVRRAGLELTMSQYLIGQIAQKQNIRVEPYTEVVAAEGDDHLEHIVTLSHPPNGQDSEQRRAADALFVMIGADANTTWLPDELERDEKGYICTGRDLTNWKLDRNPFALETSMPGVFCAGDVRHNSIKRVSSGVGEGSMAIAFIHQYMALQNF